MEHFGNPSNRKETAERGFFLPLCVLFLAVSAGCTPVASAVKARSSSTSQNSETIYKTVDQTLSVQLSAADSLRLSKVLKSSSSNAPSEKDLSETENKEEFSSEQADLQIACKSSSESDASKQCSLSMNLKPLAPENFIESDSDSNEHMFQLRNTDDAKKLYAALNLKEWDLQGSTYKRFASSDNKMILECILDDERSRCSVFLSNGESDELSGD